MNAVIDGPRLVIAVIAAVAVLVPASASPTDGYSSQHRLVGPAPASVAASSSSSSYRLYLVGGSGGPVGIAASANASIVAGGASNLLPTERIFGSGMGD